MLSVKDCGPHPHPSAGHLWWETGDPFAPWLTAVLRVRSSPREGVAPREDSPGPPALVKGRPQGRPLQRARVELKNRPRRGRAGLTNSALLPAPTGPFLPEDSPPHPPPQPLASAPLCRFLGPQPRVSCSQAGQDGQREVSELRAEKSQPAPNPVSCPRPL